MFSQRNLLKAPNITFRDIFSSFLESLVRSFLYCLGDLQDAALSFTSLRHLVLAALQHSCFTAFHGHVISTSEMVHGFEDLSYYVDADSKQLLLHAVYHSLAGGPLQPTSRPPLASIRRILLKCGCQSGSKMQTRLVMAAAKEVQASVVMVDADVLDEISRIALGRKLPRVDASAGSSWAGLLAGGLSWFFSGGSTTFAWEIVQEFCRGCPDRVILFVKDVEQTLGCTEEAVWAFHTAFQLGARGCGVGEELDASTLTIIAGTSLKETGSNRIVPANRVKRAGEDANSNPAGVDDEAANLFDFSFDLPREESIMGHPWESIFHVQVQIQPPPEGHQAVAHYRQLSQDAEEDERDRNYSLAKQAGDMAGLVLPDKDSIVFKHRSLSLWEWCKVITWSSHQQLYLSSLKKIGHSIGASDHWLAQPGTRITASLPADFCLEDEMDRPYSDIFPDPKACITRTWSACQSGSFRSMEDFDTVKRKLRRQGMEMKGEFHAIESPTLISILYPIVSLLLLWPRLFLYFISLSFSFFSRKDEDSSIPLNSSLTFMNPVFAEEKYCEGTGQNTSTQLCEESVMYGLKMLERSRGQQPQVRPENSYERRLLVDVLNPIDLGTGFSSVGALTKAKDALREAVQLPLQHPELFGKSSLIQPCKGVLLFGPPGTGKTMLARAAAAECGASFLAVQPSTVLSKWVGDGVKNVRAVFSLATKLSPCVVFVDEVDALLGQRNAGEDESMRELKNEFMSQWDGIRSGALGAAARVMVLGATNRPQDIDEAVLRRFSKRIFCDLPNEKDLIAILDVMLAGEDIDSSVDNQAIARLVKGYSGSDLKQVCTAAAMRPVRDYLASVNNRDRNSSQEPALAGLRLPHVQNCGHDGATKMDWEQTLTSCAVFGNEPEVGLVKRLILEDHDTIVKLAKNGSACPRSIDRGDFECACREIAPSVESSSASLQALRDWNQKWGDGASSRSHNMKLSYFM